MRRGQIYRKMELATCRRRNLQAQSTKMKASFDEMCRILLTTAPKNGKK